MCLFPFLNLGLLPRSLVLPIGEDVQEFQSGHPEDIIPRASADLGDRIYVGDPSPFEFKRISNARILAIIFALFSLSLICWTSRLQ